MVYDLNKWWVLDMNVKFTIADRRHAGATSYQSLDGSFENEALENEDRSMKHSKLENEAPKTRKRSTQESKTKHPKLETCLSFKNTRQSLVKSPMLTQQKSSTVTNRMQFKTMQVELRGVANAIPSPWLLAILELCRVALGRVSDLN